MNTDTTVMLEMQHSNVNLDYFKTLILQEISKTQNQHQEDFYAFSEVTDQLDVQAANFSFTQLNRSGGNFS